MMIDATKVHNCHAQYTNSVQFVMLGSFTNQVLFPAEFLFQFRMLNETLHMCRQLSVDTVPKAALEPKPKSHKLMA